MTDMTDRQIAAWCRDQFEGNHRQPKFFKGESIQSELMFEGLDMEDDSIYCRLSDGFADRTPLHGPYATVKEAADCLVATYGNDS